MDSRDVLHNLDDERVHERDGKFPRFILSSNCGDDVVGEMRYNGSRMDVGDK